LAQAARGVNATVLAARRLAINPPPTGSMTFAKTIEASWAVRCGAATVTPAEAKITSGSGASNSVAYLSGLSALQLTPI